MSPKVRTEKAPGMGIRVDDTSDVADEIELLLRSKERLSAMSHAAKGQAKPQATLDIAKLILNHKDQSPGMDVRLQPPSPNYV